MILQAFFLHFLCIFMRFKKIIKKSIIITNKISTPRNHQYLKIQIFLINDIHNMIKWIYQIIHYYHPLDLLLHKIIKLKKKSENSIQNYMKDSLLLYNKINFYKYYFIFNF